MLKIVLEPGIFRNFYVYF